MKGTLNNKTQKEMDDLCTIVIATCGCDIMKVSNKRDVVEARKIFAKILRDRGHTVSDIARYLKKDHTSIVHYLKDVDSLLNQLPSMNNKYHACCEHFHVDREVIVINMKEKELEREIRRLNNKIDTLILEKSVLVSINNSYDRLGDIVELVNQRTPNGKEDFIKKKINSMFNGITSYK